MARTVQTIDDLKALISSKGGVARSNVFAVALPPIAGLRSRELNLLCSNVNLPGRQIMTQERDIGLITQKVANNQAYDDVNLTFRCLNDYGIREYFEAWQNKCIDQASLEVGYLNEYAFITSEDDTSHNIFVRLVGTQRIYVFATTLWVFHVLFIIE